MKVARVMKMKRRSRRLSKNPRKRTPLMMSLVSPSSRRALQKMRRRPVRTSLPQVRPAASPRGAKKTKMRLRLSLSKSPPNPRSRRQPLRRRVLLQLPSKTLLVIVIAIAPRAVNSRRPLRGATIASGIRSERVKPTISLTRNCIPRATATQTTSTVSGRTRQ